MLCIKTELKKFNNNYQKNSTKIKKKIDFKVVELNLKETKNPKTRKGKSNERKRGKKMKSTLKKTEKRNNTSGTSCYDSSFVNSSRS